MKLWILAKFGQPESCWNSLRHSAYSEPGFLRHNILDGILEHFNNASG